MKSKILIIIGVVVFLFLALLVFTARSSQPDSKRIDEKELDRQSFSYKDKSPGGCYAMFKALSHMYYYEMKPQVVTKPFSRTYAKDATLSSGSYNLYVVVANKLLVSDDDARNMVRFASAGNELFIATNQPDSALMALLSIGVRNEGAFLSSNIAEQHYVNKYLAPDTLFSRTGIRGGSYFYRMDSSRATILGTDARGRPDFIRIKIGEGSVFVSLQPSTLTNYFLMDGRNMVSLERQLAYTNLYADHVYWDEFYKYQTYRQSSDFSEWQVLMRYPSMRWALWLALALLLLYIIFESKRRQRIIPEKPVLVNNSLEFVDALGQLYYQQHDNKNLAQKIIQHWLEFIRTRYYLNTNALDDAFAEALSRKSVMPLEQVRGILRDIKRIQSEPAISDQYLQEFYKNIQSFYLNTK